MAGKTPHDAARYALIKAALAGVAAAIDPTDGSAVYMNSTGSVYAIELADAVLAAAPVAALDTLPPRARGRCARGASQLRSMRLALRSTPTRPARPTRWPSLMRPTRRFKPSDSPTRSA